jgi:flagellar biosynthetic protein FliO
LASSPARKRAVAASRSVSEVAAKRPAHNYALRLAESVEDTNVAEDNFALRMSEAVRAIEAAQSDAPPSAPRAHGRKPAAVAAPTVPPARAPVGVNGLAAWLATLDKMPPIRLPIGPAIRWRYGLPALIAVVVVMVFVSRPSARVDAQAVRLPTPDTYPVQLEAPLFTNSPSAQVAAAAAPADQPAQPIGVPEPATGGFDLVDIGVKLIAVLGLAYGCLMLLKRAGLGGGTSVRGGSTQGMRVVSSLALAPNRSVHVIRVPGGKTLLVGATPNAVNLIADLGDLAEDETPDTASFIDVLKGKLT